MRRAENPGVDAVTAPHLEMIDQQAARTGLLGALRRLPATLREVVALAWQASPGATVAALAAQVASALFTAFALAATTRALTPLFAAGPTPRRVAATLPGLAAIAAAYAARGLLDAVAAWAQACLTPTVRVVAQKRLFAALVGVELVAFDDAAFAQRLARARDRGIFYVELIVDQVASLTGTTANLLALTVVLGVLNPLLVPLLALTALPRALAGLRSARVSYEVTARSANLLRHQLMLTDLMSERDAAAEARAYNAEPFLRAEHTRVGTAVRDAEIHAGRLRVRGDLVGRAFGALGVAATYLALGLSASAGVISLPAAGTAVVALRGAQAAMGTLLMTMSRTYAYGLYVADHAAFVADALARSPTATGSLSHVFEQITAAHVTFAYPSAHQPAVRDVSLTIRRGQIVALVGENGSGKTTLARLLAGLYQPQAGTLRWDSQDIATVAPAALRDHIAYINQQPVRWPMSARVNITLGRHDHADPHGHTLAQAARDSGADEIIQRLPRGYDTPLSPRFPGGQDLSGGQWQRLAIARAFYRDAPLLICDEPAAALDPRAEAAAYDNLRRLAAGRTVILVSHRLTSVQSADHIYVLHHGSLIEHGTHPELMARHGRYADLYTIQAAAYATSAPEPPAGAKHELIDITPTDAGQASTGA